jgi:hypothetical protein
MTPAFCSTSCPRALLRFVTMAFLALVSDDDLLPSASS